MRKFGERDHELIYALDASGKMVYIEDIPNDKRGLACGCICSKCKSPLIAKLGHDVPHGKKPHFAHPKGVECQGAAMSALHRLAEEILEEEKAVRVPGYKGIPAKTLSFIEVETEKRNDRSDLQPDIVGIAEDGLRFHIEICNTSEVKEPKLSKITSSEITCLQIDVRGHEMDRKETLKEFLINSSDDRMWLNNTNYEKKISEVLTKIKNNQLNIFEKYGNQEGYEVKPAYKCYEECISTNGKCIYQKDNANVDGIEFIICDVEQKERDSFEYRQQQSHQNTIVKKAIDNNTINHQSLDEIMKKSNQSLLYDPKGKSIEQIVQDLKNEGFVYFGVDVKGEIMMCDKIKGLDGIALLFKSEIFDRVYPIQVFALGVDCDRLRYKKIRCCRDIKIAERDFCCLRDNYEKFSEELFQDGDGMFLKQRVDLPF